MGLILAFCLLRQHSVTCTIFASALSSALSALTSGEKVQITARLMRDLLGAPVDVTLKLEANMPSSGPGSRGSVTFKGNTAGVSVAA